MATQVTNYQCPACTAPMHFSAESGRLECEFCRSSYSVGEIDVLYKDQNQSAAQVVPAEAENIIEESHWGRDAQKMRAYSCPSCGAELICYFTTAATSCPYCGNPTIVPGQFEDTLRPDFIIPFKYSREEAKEGFRLYCKTKRLLPKAFTEENHIEEIKGMYVPFWLFDAKGRADVTFAGTRTTSHVSGPIERITTQHYRVRRVGRVEFRNVPVDGSSKMPDEYMEAIEPFDYEKLQPFSMSYLPGFLADRYDLSHEKVYDRARIRMEESTEEAVRNRVHGYDTLVPISKNIQMQQVRRRYAMLPVWTLHTKYRGKDYLFAMNGQTGKMVGNLPISWGKLLGKLAGITLGGTALITAFFMLFG